MIENLTAADFQPRVGEAFRLTPEGGEATDAVLGEVTEHGAGDGEHRAPFSIFFNAPAGPAEQGTFRVEHDDADPIDLFLVPVGQGPDGEGVVYEAVFG